LCWLLNVSSKLTQLLYKRSLASSLLLLPLLLLPPCSALCILPAPALPFFGLLLSTGAKSHITATTTPDQQQQQQLPPT
jgi:hypothetical protein